MLHCTRRCTFAHRLGCGARAGWSSQRMHCNLHYAVVVWRSRTNDSDGEKESPIWVKRKDNFKPRVHSLSIVSFWMVPAVDMGLRLTKIQDLFKTFSANRQIQDFFKVWKRLLKIQDLFKTLRPACEPCYKHTLPPPPQKKDPTTSP